MIRPILILLPTLLLAVFAAAGPNDPIVGQKFERLIASQYPKIQEELMIIFPESEGYIVLAGLTLNEHFHGNAGGALASSGDNPGQLRLICSNPKVYSSAIAILSDSTGVGRRFLPIESPCGSRLPLYTFESENQIYQLRVYTGHSMRHSIWAGEIHSHPDYSKYEIAIAQYSAEVERALTECTGGDIEKKFPEVSLFGLPDKFDFYAPPPDYVIQGYQNYKDFMRKHAAIRTDFVHDVYEIQPSDSLLEALKATAPCEAYPNKEAANLQHEFKKFFERGGDLRSMNSLTTVGFDTLRAGEYFYAVGLSGRIRFGRELLREEVERIEAETGRKVPRANHAFLFPGEPVLTAGAFFVEIVKGKPEIVRSNAGSGHYFYSNISPTIRDDITQRSNHYLLTLGHFFNSLDNLQIPYRGITISKF